MQIFSETTSQFFSKVIIDTFGSYLRAGLVSLLIFVLGGLSGAFIIATTIDPRVSAIENDQTDLRKDFDQGYGSVDARLKLLEDAKIETSVQLQMIILYQIPQAERERLREEAEIQVQQKLPETND